MKLENLIKFCSKTGEFGKENRPLFCQICARNFFPRLPDYWVFCIKLLVVLNKLAIFYYHLE